MHAPWRAAPRQQHKHAVYGGDALSQLLLCRGVSPYVSSALRVDKDIDSGVEWPPVEDSLIHLANIYTENLRSNRDWRNNWSSCTDPSHCLACGTVLYITHSDAEHENAQTCTRRRVEIRFSTTVRSAFRRVIVCVHLYWQVLTSSWQHEHGLGLPWQQRQKMCEWRTLLGHAHHWRN